MSVTLSDYITECRRLLHDANGNFWVNSELTDYINDARERLVRDTGCLRTIQSFNTVANQETYNFSDLTTHANDTVDILNINLYWGNTRVPLRYLAWTDFNSQLRFWQNYIGRPIAFSLYGPRKIYLGPVPDEVYYCEVDTVILPTDLVNASDEDDIPYPWTTPVAYYACYRAKYKEQSFGEAEIFKQEYLKQTQSVLTSTYTRRMPTPYSQAF